MPSPSGGAALKLAETLEYLNKCYPHPIKVGLVMGSGLGQWVESLNNPVVLPFDAIPHFPVATVPGHRGNLIFSEWAPGVAIACLQGRFHYYEGYPMEDVTYPIRVLAGLGSQAVLLSNAAGGLNTGFSPGDLMLIDDHLNLMGENPLRGLIPDDPGRRFVDMTEAYDGELRGQALRVARKANIGLKSGVYVGLSGPSYETPAEIRMLQRLGGDAVGMSTVPEVIVARQCGMRVLGVSCITNLAAGMSGNRLSHQEVVDTAWQAQTGLATLFMGLLETLLGPAQMALPSSTAPL